MPDYITVGADNSLHRYDDAGNEVWGISTSNFIEEVVVDSDAEVYVQEANTLIEKYDSSGNFVWDVAADATAIDVDDHRVYTVRGDDISIRDPSTGSQVASVQDAHGITRDVVAGFNEDFYTVGEDSNQNAEIKHWNADTSFDWRITLTDAIDSGYEITVNEEYVYIGVDYRLYEIDINTQDKTFFQDPDAERFLSMSVDDSRRVAYATGEHFGVHDFDGNDSWRKSDFDSDTLSDISPRPNGEYVVVDHDGAANSMDAYLYDSSGTEVWSTSLGISGKSLLTGTAGFPSYAGSRFYWNNAPYVEHTTASGDSKQTGVGTKTYITGRVSGDYIRLDTSDGSVVAHSNESGDINERDASITFDGYLYPGGGSPERIDQDGNQEGLGTEFFTQYAVDRDKLYGLRSGEISPYVDDVVVKENDSDTIIQQFPLDFSVDRNNSGIAVGHRGDFYVANEQNLYHFNRDGELEWSVKPSASGGNGKVATAGGGYVYYDTSAGIKKVEADSGNVVKTFSVRSLSLSGNAKGYVASYQPNGSQAIIDPSGNVQSQNITFTNDNETTGAQTMQIRRNGFVVGAPISVLGSDNYVPHIAKFDLNFNKEWETDPEDIESYTAQIADEQSAFPLVTGFPPYEAFGFEQDGTIEAIESDSIGQTSTNSTGEQVPSAVPTDSVAGVQGPSTSSDGTVFQSETNATASTASTSKVVLAIDSFTTNASGTTSTGVTIDTSPFTSSTPVSVTSQVTESITGNVALSRSDSTRVVSFTTNSEERREIVGNSEPTTSITTVTSSSIDNQGVDTKSIPTLAEAVDNQTATRLDDSVVVQTFGGSTTTSTVGELNPNHRR